MSFVRRLISFTGFCAVTLCFLTVTCANEDMSCAANRAPAEMPCTSSNTLLNGDSVKMPGDNNKESWLSNSYNSILNSFNFVKDSLSGNLYKKIEQTDETEDDVADMDIETMMAEANKLAAMMAANNMNFNKEALERFTAFTSAEIEPEGERSDYEYLPVTRREVETVGEDITLDLGDGVLTKLTALSLDPPLFEIPNFLSTEECDYIISKASEKGLHVSRVFQDKNVTDRNENVDSIRVSESSVLDASEVGMEFLTRLQTRAAQLVGVPLSVVQRSGKLAIGKYGAGGHYHAHLDSTDLNPEKMCCFQKQCSQYKGADAENTDCCRLCRYATVLYYLNDVERGGETAFPLADYTYSQIRARSDELQWGNLTKHCYDSQVVIKPAKGKAIMWYNHFTDKRGYLGGLSKRSYHGGCDVTKGTKWIATNWVSMPTYKHRYIRSKHEVVNDE